jgi:hypothetical protein
MRPSTTQRFAWLILALAAIALRLPDIGNPLLDVDEQMYVLVGQRMWDGALPYVDIWDRKPIGLFLIYAAGQMLPGDPFFACHLVSLAAAWGTAAVITAFARRFASAGAARGAGLLYLLWLELIGGRGGQSPVFYNLLIAAAAWLSWDSIIGRRRAALPAMLLAGLALQIKPTALFEGCYLGLSLLAASWQRHARPMRLAGEAMLYVTIALAPTAAAYASYVAIGHGEAWRFANVRSIFLRQVTPTEPVAMHLVGAFVVLLVPLVLAVRGILLQPRPARLFLSGWLVAAVTGWLLVPPYFNHYALPLLVPLAVAAAGSFSHRPMQLLAGVIGGGLLLVSGYPHRGETAHARGRVATLARVINGARGSGCLFVFQAPPALYVATRSCLPSRYPFPSHLVEPSEAGAIGVDPAAEVDRVLTARPPVIATAPSARDGRHGVVDAVNRMLVQHYHAIYAAPGITIYRVD